MKITKELAAKFIQESASFRQFVVDEMFKTDTSTIFDAVRGIVARNTGNKIAGIKELREFSRGKMDEFQNAFPNVTYSDLGVLGLSDSKKIVEQFGL